MYEFASIWTAWNIPAKNVEDLLETKNTNKFCSNFSVLYKI